MARRIVLYGLWAVTALVLLVLLAAIGVRLWAPSYERKAEQAWTTPFESMDALLARYPPAPHNASAITLASLVEPLGISLLAPDPRASPASARSETHDILNEIQQYVANQAGTDDAVEAVPADVTAWLVLERAALDAIEAQLLGPEPVRWAVDLTTIVAFLPEIAALRHISDVLLIRALVAARRGDWQAAQRSLAASDRLNLTMRDRPELVGQLSAMALNAQRNGVLRQLPPEAIASADQFTDHDWPTALLRALQADTLQFTTALRNAGRRNDRRDSGWLVSLARPLLIGVPATEYSLRLHRFVLELHKADPCAFDVDAYARRVEADAPWWNYVGRFGAPGRVLAWATAGRAAIDDEFTGMVLHTRRALQGQDPLPEQTRSRVCANLVWTWTTQANGDVTIAPERNPFVRPRSPMTFRVRRARSGL